MKKFFYIASLSLLVLSCRKESIPFTEPCVPQLSIPDRASCGCDEFVPYIYTGSNCGIIPFSIKNYWVYEDSIFLDGQFSHVETDTLRFSKSYQIGAKGLTWWEGDKAMGLPEFSYANDSAIYSLEQRMFTFPCTMDVKKYLFISSQDSIRFLTNFGDESAIGTERNNQEVKTPSGNYSACLLLEKYAPGYRRDRVYIKPGIGVVKYVHQEAAIGNNDILTQRISTLKAYHLQ